MHGVKEANDGARGPQDMLKLFFVAGYRQQPGLEQKASKHWHTVMQLLASRMTATLDGDDAAAAMDADWAAGLKKHGMQEANDGAAAAAAATTGAKGPQDVPTLDDIMDAVCLRGDSLRHAVALHLDSVHDTARMRRLEVHSREGSGVDLRPQDGSGSRPGPMLEAIPSGRVAVVEQPNDEIVNVRGHS
jgi:hypothetical protein